MRTTLDLTCCREHLVNNLEPQFTRYIKLLMKHCGLHLVTYGIWDQDIPALDIDDLDVTQDPTYMEEDGDYDAAMADTDSDVGYEGEWDDDQTIGNDERLDVEDFMIEDILNTQNAINMFTASAASVDLSDTGFVEFNLAGPPVDEGDEAPEPIPDENLNFGGGAGTEADFEDGPPPEIGDLLLNNNRLSRLARHVFMRCGGIFSPS